MSYKYRVRKGFRYWISKVKSYGAGEILEVEKELKPLPHQLEKVTEAKTTKDKAS